MAPVVLVLALSFLPAILAEPFHLPLIHQSSKSIDWNHHTDYLRTKYGYKKAFTHHSNRRASSSGLAILDQGLDSSYVAAMSIGTPSQPFLVVLDTGSSDLWLPGANCATCTSGSPIFDTSQSSTFKQISTSSPLNSEVTITYGSGAVRGTLGSDTVNMGGFTVPSQTFLTANAMTTGLVDAPVSGLMGLAFESLASTEAVPFWQAVTNSSQLSAPEMSIWLARNRNAVNDTALNPGGVFTLGGTNSSLFSGDIEFISIMSPPSFWLLPLSTLTLNGATVSLSITDPPAAIDTGTTLIGGPHNDVVAFYSAIPNAISLTDLSGMFAFPCNTSVNVSISFGGGQSWPISPQDFNAGSLPGIQNSRDDFCLGALFDLSAGSSIPPGSSSPSWVIGDTFLKNVYTVFRSSPASVGFAQLSSAAGGTGTAPAGSSTSGSSASGSSTSGATMSTILPAFLMLTTTFTAVIMSYL